MKKRIRPVVAVLVFAVFLGMVPKITSEAYVAQHMTCPNCHANLTSYAREANARFVTRQAHSGDNCPGCGHTVANEDNHMYIVAQDKYYFLCTSNTCSKLPISSRKYTSYLDNKVVEHYTNGTRDF